MTVITLCDCFKFFYARLAIISHIEKNTIEKEGML